jgi:hypothetical protein
MRLIVAISLCVSNRHGAHGFTTRTCVFLEWPTFRETIVRLWWIAVAASEPSMVDKGLSSFFAGGEQAPAIDDGGVNRQNPS